MHYFINNVKPTFSRNSLNHLSLILLLILILFDDFIFEVLASLGYKCSPHNSCSDVDQMFNNNNNNKSDNF